MKFAPILVSALTAVLLSSPFASADARLAKVCGMSQRTLAKNPLCSAEIKAEAAKIDCEGDAKASEKMNAIQAKCQAGASAAGNASAQKLADMKAAGASDPKVVELKNKLEAAKAAKAEAEAKH